MTLSTSGVVEQAALKPWLPYCRFNVGHPKIRLLCFAHAGGSAVVFNKWPDKLPWTVQTCAVQLPGREARTREPFMRRMPELMEGLCRVLLPWINGPVALLGHSLGAKIAFEFARRITSQSNPPEIVHLFVSGSPAPHLRSTEMPIYSLPKEEFVQRLKKFGGTPHDVLENPEIMELLTPRLRADFELDDTYTFEPGKPLSCPVTAWAGDRDELVSEASLEAWGEQTTGPFRYEVLKGAHFALYEREAEVIPQIRAALAGSLGP